MIKHQWEDHGLVRRYEGVVSLKEIAQSDANVQADARFDDIHYLIDDFRACTNVIDIDKDLVDELAAIASAAVRFPTVFRHAVVTKLPMVLKLAEDFVNSGFINFPDQQFQDMGEARAWVKDWPQPAKRGKTQT
jgi:hypothetical protein